MLPAFGIGPERAVRAGIGCQFTGSDRATPLQEGYIIALPLALQPLERGGGALQPAVVQGRVLTARLATSLAVPLRQHSLDAHRP